MKKLILFAVCLISIAIPTRAATPSFQSFNTNDFIVAPPFISLAHTNTGGTNIVINSSVTYSNVTFVIEGGSTVNITNSSVTINGTNVATINPTIGRVPVNGDGTNFFDSPLAVLNTNTVTVTDFDVVQLTVTNLIGGGALYAATFGPVSGIVTNLPFAPGVLQSDGTTMFWNATGDPLWTNNNHNYFPVQQEDGIFVGNLNSFGTLVARGNLLLYPSDPVQLTNGVTLITCYQQTFIPLDGDGTTNVQIRLSDGNGAGATLLLTQLSTNKFSLLNGDALWDNGTMHVYLPGGDWNPDTPGMSMLLIHNFRGWTEATRFGGPTNVITQELWQFSGGNLQPVDLTQPLFWTNAVSLDAAHTTAIFHKSNDLYYTNSATQVSLFVEDGQGDMISMQARNGANATINATSSSLQVTPNLLTANVQPYNSTSDLGANGVNTYANLWLNGTERIYGFGVGDPSNYSRLATSHTGTNGTVVFNSQGSGSAGAGKPFLFEIDGTSYVRLKQLAGSPYIELINGGNTGQILESGGQVTIADTSAINFDAGATIFSVTSAGLARIKNGTATNEAQIYGYSNGSDASLIAIGHTGTNGVGVIASRANGVPPGVARPIAVTVGNTNMVQWDGANGASTTGMLIYENGTAQRVTIGSADSGGTGFRVLRVSN